MINQKSPLRIVTLLLNVIQPLITMTILILTAFMYKIDSELDFSFVYKPTFVGVAWINIIIVVLPLCLILLIVLFDILFSPTMMHKLKASLSFALFNSLLITFLLLQSPFEKNLIIIAFLLIAITLFIFKKFGAGLTYFLLPIVLYFTKLSRILSPSIVTVLTSRLGFNPFHLLWPLLVSSIGCGALTLLLVIWYWAKQRKGP